MESDDNGGVKILFGILVTILGLVLLASQAFTTIVTMYFLGWALIIGGVIEAIYGLFIGKLGPALLVLSSGILTLIIGLSIVLNPTIAASTLTLLISVLFIVVGLIKGVGALMNREYNWGWSLTGGILTFLLGVMIFSGLPTAGLYVIGLFIGLSMTVTGVIMVAAGFSGRSVSRVETVHAHDIEKGGDKDE